MGPDLLAGVHTVNKVPKWNKDVYIDNLLR